MCGPTSTSTTPRSESPEPAARAAAERILGIDPGSSTVGWGVLERRGRRWTLAGCGVLRSSPRASLADKLHTLHARLLALLERWRPQEAAVEDLFYARNARAALVLGHARGVLLLGLRQHELSPHSYAPRLVKQAVTGSGSADKERVREWIGRSLGIPITKVPLDASDALAVALCHAHSRSFRRAVAAAGARKHAALR